MALGFVGDGCREDIEGASAWGSIDELALIAIALAVGDEEGVPHPMAHHLNAVGTLLLGEDAPWSEIGINKKLHTC